MKVLNKRCMRTLACPGSYAYDAEMKLEGENGKTIFLHVNYSDGEHFTVDNGSIFDYMTQESKEDPDVKFSEEYESLNKAKKSNYYKYFCELDRMVNDLIEEKRK